MWKLEADVEAYCVTTGKQLRALIGLRTRATKAVREISFPVSQARRGSCLGLVLYC